MRSFLIALALASAFSLGACSGATTQNTHVSAWPDTATDGGLNASGALGSGSNGGHGG